MPAAPSVCRRSGRHSIPSRFACVTVSPESAHFSAPTQARFKFLRRLATRPAPAPERSSSEAEASESLTVTFRRAFAESWEGSG